MARHTGRFPPGSSEKPHKQPSLRPCFQRSWSARQFLSDFFQSSTESRIPRDRPLSISATASQPSQASTTAAFQKVAMIDRFGGDAVRRLRPEH